MPDISTFKDQIISVDDGSTILRILQPEDVSATYVDWMNNPEVTRYTEQKYQIHDLDGVRAFVAEKLASPCDLLFGIFVEGIHVGNIKLGPVNKNHMVADVSYFIGNRDYWGHGIATRAIRAVSDFAFEKVGLEKVTAGCYATNIGSEKALLNSGFKLEGTRRSQYICDGVRVDSLLFGRLKGD